MIPDFRTYVNESVWADIHKRSNGSSVRKEDILKDIYEYLTSKYNTTEDKIELDYKDDNETIYIPIFRFYNTYATLWIFSDKINFSAINPNKYMDLPVKKMKDKLNTFYENLVDNYSAKIEEFNCIRDCWYTFELKPLGKKGIVTKEFCTDVIDFILENIDDKITKLIKKKI